MAADRVERDVFIEAPIEVVWEVITRPEHVVGWFSDEADLDLRPGGSGVLTFTSGARPATHHLRFEVVEPPRRLTYRWLHPVDDEPRPGNSTLVDFRLEEEGAGTRLRVVESGIQAMPWPEAEKEDFADSHGRGWSGHLERLCAHAAAAADRRGT